MDASDRVEWYVELTRRDGKPISVEEMVAAWESPWPWRRPWLMLGRPVVTGDGTFVGVGDGFWHPVMPRPQTCEDRLLLNYAEGRRTKVRPCSWFRRWFMWAARSPYRVTAVPVLRRFAYQGPIPRQVVDWAALSLVGRTQKRLGRGPRYFVVTNAALFFAGLVLVTEKLSGSSDFPWLTVGWAALFGGLSWLFLRYTPWAGTKAPRRAGWIERHYVGRRLWETGCWLAVEARTCHVCGYDLRDSDGPRCPECGHPDLRWWCERGRLGESVSALPDLNQGG